MNDTLALVHEYRCPHCRWLSHVGFCSSGTWWETKCRRCNRVYGWGESAMLSAGATNLTQYSFRCPYPAEDKVEGLCNRQLLRGYFTPDSWWETRCPKPVCTQASHIGPYGGGPLALQLAISSPLPYHIRPAEQLVVSGVRLYWNERLRNAALRKADQCPPIGPLAPD